MSKQRDDITPTDSGIMNALADTNNYAAGNEGETIIEREQKDDTDITNDELDLLDQAGSEKDEDDINEEAAQLDDSDEDGDALNEGSDLTGEDLDVPGADLDDDDELLGEEDEENNSYSESDQGDK